MIKYNYLIEAVNGLDAVFGKGFAKKNPALVVEVAKASYVGGSISSVGDMVGSALDRLCDILVSNVNVSVSSDELGEIACAIKDRARVVVEQGAS